MTRIQVKRVYADPDGSGVEDGYRIYVDRLWPRGESKEKFHYDLWAKDVAPSDELRRWYHDDPADRWDEFRRRYLAELEANPAADSLASSLSGHELVTLLFSSREPENNNAHVLADFLRTRLGGD